MEIVNFTNSNIINFLGRLFFCLVLVLFIAEQVSEYHIAVSENIELSDSEEGEGENELDEKEKKELFRSELSVIHRFNNIELTAFENKFLKLLTSNHEVHTPPPDC